MANKAIFVNLYWEYFVNTLFWKYYVNFNWEFYVNISDNIYHYLFGIFWQYFVNFFWEYSCNIFFGKIMSISIANILPNLIFQVWDHFQSKINEGIQHNNPGKGIILSTFWVMSTKYNWSKNTEKGIRILDKVNMKYDIN